MQSTRCGSAADYPQCCVALYSVVVPMVHSTDVYGFCNRCHDRNLNRCPEANLSTQSICLESIFVSRRSLTSRFDICTKPARMIKPGMQGRTVPIEFGHEKLAPKMPYVRLGNSGLRVGDNATIRSQCTDIVADLSIDIWNGDIWH